MIATGAASQPRHERPSGPPYHSVMPDAERGFDAICPNLHWRDAPGAAPDDAAAASRANGGVPDSRLIGDVAGAASVLRSVPTSNGRVGDIGYCSGGRQCVLAACHLDLDASVECYGGAGSRPRC